MPSNAEAAEILRAIADLLDLEGERFKPEAYRRAARSIETLTEDLSALAERKELDTIPGVGEAIGEKLQEYLKTGRIAYYDRIRTEVPSGVLELMRLAGVGPKTARRFWVELHITSPEELRRAIDTHRLDGVSGIGPRKIELLRSALTRPPASTGARIPLAEAYVVAERIVAAIRAKAPVERIEIAGSLRRRRETIGDLDLLACSEDAKGVFDVVSALPEVREVMLRGETKETVRLASGLQIDVRVVAAKEFGAALVYFTGSKDHNVHLRTIARDRGLKINEYGVFRGEERVGGATEDEVYAALKLAWIPPELRENCGEIEAAAAGTLPELVTERDVRGELHWHVPSEASREDVEATLAEARRRRMEYVGAVVAGTSARRGPVRVRREALQRLQELHGKRPSGMPIVWLVGEVAGTGAAPEEMELDYLIRRPTTGPARASRTPRPPTLLISHLRPSASATDVGHDLRAWIDWAAGHGAALEVGPGADRLDSIGAAEVRARKGTLAIPTGLGAPPDDPTFPVALGLARRAQATGARIVNSRSRTEIERLLSGKKTDEKPA
ncbi:MAG: helix-hairpin-helix domain-containing protein [Thermoplasmata archaeon]